MNQRPKKVLLTLIGLFVLLVVWQRFAGITAVPSWVLLSGLGIVFSGFMWWKTSQSEKEEEDRWIEQEGRVFIRRMEEEREKKRASS
ncbi:sporulation YhaL family protein [Salibacterium halotolerans]|uniref:Sporulation protein YhaL n=1 Tax=Salibacterium halotolerans TaxID=1884432 RepID=A0A1I5UHK5_9BACI|nr:sporulation YhaL family protein [Salibacterium halotolerans]SFP94710.1 Sporulation protein YhaL [Salibacterium halotolerans]